MSWLNRVTNLFHRNRVDEELGEELRFHLEARTRANLDAGMAAEEAQRDASRRFGNATLAKERAHEMEIAVWIEVVVRDLGYALRSLRNSPAITAAAMMTLALGIGANTAIFSMVYGILLKPTPYSDPGRLCLLWKSVPRKGLDRDWTSYPTFQDWKRDAGVFQDLAAFLRPEGSIVNLSGTDNVEQLQSTKVSGSFFSVLGTPALLGRTFTAGEVAGNSHLAVISYGFWRRHFLSAKDVVGRRLEIDGSPFEVIGVMPADFAFPARESQAWTEAKDTELWLPIESDSRWSAFQRVRIADAFGVVARLSQGATAGQAQAEMSAISNQIARRHPDTDRYLGVRVVPLALYLVGTRVRLTLGLFMGAVMVVLLMACANVAGLFVSRSFARRQAVAIQIALGAARSDILRQVLAEAILLSLVAGAAGLGLAGLGVKALITAAPPDLPRLQDVHLNGYLLLFALAVSLLSGTLSSLWPAWTFCRINPQDALRERGESSRYRIRMQSSLVFLECALTIVLLTGTGLLLRSAIRLASVDLGFRADHLVTEDIILSGDKYKEDARIRAFVDEAIRRVDALPGVRSAAIGAVFLGGHLPNSQLEVEGRDGATSIIDSEPATWTSISEGFFQTMEIPVLRGREFSSADGPDATPAVVVSQTMAQRLWPGRDPIGRRFKYGVPGEPTHWLTVVGVAGDTVGDPEGHPISVVYFPFRQKLWIELTLMARTQSDPAAMETAIGDQVHQIDKTLPRTTPSTVEEQLWSLGSQRRFQIELFSIFSLLAVVLATVGMYAVMAYAMGQRTYEIGLRLALGARRSNVLLIVLRQALPPVGLGLLAGLAIAFAMSSTFTGLLYGVTATDPLTYGCVSLFLLTVAAIAVFIPAHRAMRIDPLIALRSE